MLIMDKVSKNCLCIYVPKISLPVRTSFGKMFFPIVALADINRFSIGSRSGEFAGQSSTPTPSFNQLLVLLAVCAGAKSCWKMKSASLKGQQKEAWSAPKCLGKRVQWCWFSKNTMDQHQQMTLYPKSDCRNLTLDFKQLGLWASPPFLQTLGPWFPNEIQNLLSSEKRSLDHWATVQFFSSAQVRCLWWQL